jgi:hypothetical protein
MLEEEEFTHWKHGIREMVVQAYPYAVQASVPPTSHSLPKQAKAEEEDERIQAKQGSVLASAQPRPFCAQMAFPTAAQNEPSQRMLVLEEEPPVH